MAFASNIVTRLVARSKRQFLLVLLTAFYVFPGLSQEIGMIPFGAWELRCNTPSDSKQSVCALTQTASAIDKEGSSLGVLVVKPKEFKNAVMRVIAPLDVYLIKGIALQVDEMEIGKALFSSCSPSGCVADIGVEGDILEKFKTGKIGVLTAYQTPSLNTMYKFKLDGFKDGFVKILVPN
jgi:invasion protein IalB